MSKKLAFIINVFREDNFHSGGEKLFFELVSNALKDGYRVDLYCSKYLYSTDEPKLKLNKVTILGDSKDYKYPDKIESLFKCFKKLIDAESYDHVIAENITPPMDIAVLQGHSLLHYKKMAGNAVEQIIFDLKKKKFIKAQEEWINQGYSKIFVPSNTLKEELMENFNLGDSLFSVLYPGVDVKEDVKPIDKHLESKQRPIVFGISAPSFSKKGGYIFLKALNF